MALSEVLDIFDKKKTALNVVVLDACRNNPLSGVGKAYGEAGLKGLKREEMRGQTLIGFAAAPGKKAADGGSGVLSPYTAALVVARSRGRCRGRGADRLDPAHAAPRTAVRPAAAARHPPQGARTDPGALPPCTRGTLPCPR